MIKIEKFSLFYKEKEVLQKRLSSLIDMKLDNIENQEIYIDKEKELNSSIKKINNEIKDLELLKDNNKNIEEKSDIESKNVESNNEIKNNLEQNK